MRRAAMFCWRAVVSSLVSTHEYHSCFVFFLLWTHKHRTQASSKDFSRPFVVTLGFLLTSFSIAQNLITEFPPFVDNLSYCGLMSTLAFRYTFVAFSSFMNLYSSSKFL
uniref:Uncharacterized protein n=1 Tax=Anguilla anguilla TaxID=7936 RepID=A0A0E9WF98_ANGAN